MNRLKKANALWITACLLLHASTSAETKTNVIYETENAETLLGVEVTTRNKGFEGKGYVDFGSSGSSIEWTKVFSGGGEATLAFRYANGDKRDRPTDLYVNDDLVTLVLWTGTGSWAGWETKEFNVTLQPGRNTVKLVQTTSGGPNVDQLIVTSEPVEMGPVPGVTGFYDADALILIKSAGMTPGTITPEFSTTVEQGKVIRQNPAASSSAPIGYPVDLVISSGPPVVG